MLRFTKPRKRIVADKLPDAGNLALAALVFGQFVGSQPCSATLAAAGLIIWSLLFGLACLLAETSDVAE
jgi:hypothetical protein